MRLISVEFDRDNVTYYAGEFVSGTMILELEKKTNCRSVTASLGWYAHGAGNDAATIVETLTVHSGELEPGVYRFPFRFNLPPGPYTYHGHYLNVDWYVEGTADVPWATDPKGDEDFILLPSRDVRPPDPELPAHTEATDTGMAGIIVGAGIAALSVLCGLYGIVEEEDFGMACCAAIGLIIAAVALYYGFHRFLATRLVGDVRFGAEPWPVHPNDTFTHTITFTPKRKMLVNAITATLVGKEEVVEGHGSDRTTHTNVLFEQSVEVASNGTLEGKQEVTFRAAFTIPDGPFYTISATDNTLSWEVTTHIDIPNWPDWEDKHQVVVTPDYSRAGSPSDHGGSNGGGSNDGGSAW